MRIMPAYVMVACATALTTGPAYGEESRPGVAVVIDEAATEVERNVVEAFVRRLEARSGGAVSVAKSVESPEADVVVRAGVAGRGSMTPEALQARDLEAPDRPEGFVLDVRPGDDGTTEAWVCGHDARGLLYGLGKLLRVGDYEKDGLTLPKATLRESPAVAERGVYFASHFNNYYERAPVDEIEAYVEDLAFWGFNSIWTWFDMNWYPEDFDRDPDSRGMNLLERVRRINRKAKSLGLETGLTTIANEGFRRQPPPELLADMSEKRGGYYPESTICPSKPGGMELILKNRRKVLELVGPIDIFMTWPFDQGSCGCPDCRPWYQTFLKMAPTLAAEARRYNPDVRVIVSTWYFKPEEMEAVQALMEQGADWFDGVLTETSAAGVFDPPAGYARLVFPEISMYGSLFTGYGSSGANPMPHRYVPQARDAAAHGYGAVLYSEGFYEDINKIAWALTLWNPERNPEDIVREYARFYFGSESADEWVELILGLESTWPQETLLAADSDKVEALHRAAEKLASQAPADPASRVRAQYLRDRAELDAKMVRIGSDEDLLREAKAVLDDAGYSDDGAALRERVARFKEQVAARVAAVRDLFETHWAYLERAHLERTTGLVITPPSFIGQRDWEDLHAVLDRALQETDDDALRIALLRGYKQWFWHNNITIDFLFL